MIRVSLSLLVIFHSQHGTFESKRIFVAEALMISHIIGPNGRQQRKPIVSSWNVSLESKVIPRKST